MRRYYSLLWVRKYDFYGETHYDVAFGVDEQVKRLNEYTEDDLPKTIRKWMEGKDMRVQYDKIHGREETIYGDNKVISLGDFLGEPTLEIEISVALENGYSLEEIVKHIERHNEGWKFNRTEARYESCIVAIFEKEVY